MHPQQFAVMRYALRVLVAERVLETAQIDRHLAEQIARFVFVAVQTQGKAQVLIALANILKLLALLFGETAVSDLLAHQATQLRAGEAVLPVLQAERVVGADRLFRAA